MAIGNVELILILWYIVGRMMMLVAYKLVSLRMLPIAAMMFKNTMMMGGVYLVIIMGIGVILE